MWVRPPVQRGLRRKFLGIEYGFLCAPDSALGFGLRSKDSAVICEVEFAVPGRNLHVRKFLLHVAEEIASETKLKLRIHRVWTPELISVIEHDAGRPAAVIAHTVQMHHLGLVGNGFAIDRRHPD